ncbi:hypothetical protein Tco_1091871 [Tanacetum coccineum]|uniref:Uncharacterized protein n=1 Tax=Tanacetum coccineum TaxID=301880 RepID=A0ABQ5IAC9_9ASTR
MSLSFPSNPLILFFLDVGFWLLEELGMDQWLGAPRWQCHCFHSATTTIPNPAKAGLLEELGMDQWPGAPRWQCHCFHSATTTTTIPNLAKAGYGGDKEVGDVEWPGQATLFNWCCQSVLVLGHE